MNETTSVVRSLVCTLNSPVPRNGGAAMRNAQTIKTLQRLGPVDVVALAITYESVPDEVVHHVGYSPRTISELQGTLGRLWAKSWFLRPMGHRKIERNWSRKSIEQVRSLARSERYDIVVASQWSTAQYALSAARSSGARLIFDTHNVEADLQTEIRGGGTHLSRRRRFAVNRLQKWERRLGKEAEQVWVCSDEDARLWRTTYGDDTPIVLVPNTVETAESPERELASGDGHLLFTGTFNYPPNVDAATELAEQILPAVRTTHPSASVQIVGREPTSALLALHDPVSGVEVVGPVPEMAPHLASAAALVVPLRTGGGTRLKILQAMAAGVPVISTSKGTEGIDLVPGQHALIGETTEELAQHCMDVLSDQTLADRLATRGHDLVTERYGRPALDRIVDDALAEMGIL